MFKIWMQGKKINLFVLIFSLVFNFGLISFVKAQSLPAPTCEQAAQDANNACLEAVYLQAASLEAGYPAQTEEQKRNCETQFIGALGKCKTAVPYSPSNVGTIVNPLFGLTLPGLIGNIIMAAMGILGTIAFILFVYSGFLWLTSAGKPEQIKKSTQTMLWAGIGLIVIFSSYFILNFVFSALTAK